MIREVSAMGIAQWGCLWMTKIIAEAIYWGMRAQSKYESKDGEDDDGVSHIC